MNIKQKIQNTTLFSDKEKVAVLVDFDNYDENTRNQLEKVIDDYNDSIKSVSKRFKANMKSELSKIESNTEGENLSQVRTAIEKINNGLDQLIPDGD